MKEYKGTFLKVDSVESVFDVSPFSCLGAPYLEGIDVQIGDEKHRFRCDHYTVCDPDVIREDGRIEMRKVMFEIFSEMSDRSRKDIFGSCYFVDIVRDHLPEDLIAGWEKWKKEEEEKKIRVRDEVQNKSNGMKIVVTVPPYMGSNSCYYFSGIRKDGKVYRDEMVNPYKKTGVHVDDLDSYLEV